MTVSDLAKKMKMTRSTLYKRFETEVLDYFELIRFGQALGYDFSKDVPEIDMYKSRLSLAGEDSPEQGNKKTLELDECRKALGQYKDEAYKLAKELNTWKDKYIEVVEELSALRLKVNGQ